MSESKIAGLYWTKEDIDSVCQVYAIHIAVTNRLVCTIDIDVPSAEVFTNLFAAAPDLLAALKGCLAQLERDTELLYEGMPHTEPEIMVIARAAIAKATEGK